MPPIGSRAPRIKILVGGPLQAGKSVVANFLAGQDRPDMVQAYTPTQGVRILEFERVIAGASRSGQDVTVTIELWFFAFWPISANDMHGLLLVMNADKSAHERSLEAWAAQFPSLKESQVMVVAQKHENAAQTRARPRLTGRVLSRVPVVFSSVDHAPDLDQLRAEFDKFLGTCIGHAMDQKDRDEAAVPAQPQPAGATVAAK